MSSPSLGLGLLFCNKERVKWVLCKPLCCVWCWDCWEQMPVISTGSPSFQANPPPALPHHPPIRASSTCFRKAWGPYERGVAAGGGIFSDLPARALVHFLTLWAVPGGGHCLPPVPSRKETAAGALQERESLLSRDHRPQAHGRGQSLHKVAFLIAFLCFCLLS